MNGLLLRVAKTLALGIGILSCCLATPAAAQLAGVKVTLANLDYGPGNATVDADITATVFYSTGVGFATAWMGYSTLNLTIPAVDWGDGAVVPPAYPTGIPFDTTSTPPGAPGPVRAYRGAFSHSYASPGPFTIKVYSSEVLFAPGYAFTGHTATFQTGFYSIFGGVISALTNRTEIPGIAVAEIPALSDGGLLALAAVLAAAGVLLLRR
ncbi:MAG: hypothetical protein AAF657_26740 [Acidobacteriota bacterium]